MRKKRMEQELNHPHFVGVRLSDIDLELLDRKAEILGGVQIRMPAETFGGKGDRVSDRSSRRYGRIPKVGRRVWNDWYESESDRTILQYGRGSFAGYGG